MGIFGELVPCSNPNCTSSGWHRERGQARKLCESIGRGPLTKDGLRPAEDVFRRVAVTPPPGATATLRVADLWSGLADRFADSYDPAAHEGPGRLDPVKDSRLVAMVIDANEELSEVVSEGRAFGPGEYDDLDEELDAVLTSEGYDTDDLAAAIVAYRRANPAKR